MAKTFGPLHSDSAQGTFADVLTFSKRSSGQQVRFQRKQKDVITPKRITQRFKFNQGLLLWQSMPQYEKDLWKVY